jgi:hypothetical protein
LRNNSYHGPISSFSGVLISLKITSMFLVDLQ